jgi:hypothetical protein
MPSIIFPQDGARIPEGTSLVLEWSSVAGAQTYAAEFFASPNSELHTSGKQPAQQWAVGQLPMGQYTWHVEAYNDPLWSGWTDTWSFSVVPHAPTALVAPTVTCQRVELVWQNQSDATTTYRITRSRNGMVDLELVVDASSHYVDFEVEPDAHYSYVVQALAASISSEHSNLLEVTVPPCASTSEEPTPTFTPTSSPTPTQVPTAVPTPTATPTPPVRSGSQRATYLPLLMQK